MRAQIWAGIIRPLLGLMVLVLCSLARAAAVESPEPAAVNPELAGSAASAAPVDFRDQTLFEVSQPIGSLTTAQRAQAIEQRLLNVAGKPANVLERLRVVEAEGRSEIYAGDTLIRTVTDADVARTGRTRAQVAADQLEVLRQALAADYKARSVTGLLTGSGFAAGATLVLIAVLVGLRALYRLVRSHVRQIAQLWHRRIGLARLRLLSADSIENFSRTVAWLLALVLGLLAVYWYLQFVFGQFPWTRGLSERMVEGAGRVVGRVFGGIVGYLPSLFSIIVIVFVTRYALKALKALFRALEHGYLSVEGFYPDWAAPTYALVRAFVIAIAAIMVFPYLPGSGSAGFQGVAAFVGLAISLGGAGAIGNLIAGIVITYMRPFSIGDRVKIADAIGDVIQKNLLVVRVRTIKNVEISIPNALVLSNHIVNFSANAKAEGLILHTSVTIGYDAPWQTVHELLIKAAKRVDGILATPEPFVLQTSLDDFYVSYEINAYTDRPSEQAALYSRLHAEIQNAFNEGGVEILSPHYAAVRDGNATAVPNDYLPKDYRAPAFNVLSRILRPNQGA